MQSFRDNLALDIIINDTDFSPCESSLLHSYPASMPAFLASRLIQAYSSKGSFVFDPFCGTGAVLIEGMRLSRNCIGTDLQKSVIRIVNVSLNIPDTDLLLGLWNSIREATNLSLSLFGNDRFESVADGFKLLQPWFHNRTFRIIQSIYSEITKIQNKQAQEVFQILLAGSLISLSKRKKRGVVHWGWVADNVLPKPEDLLFVDPINVIDKKLTKLVKFVNSLDSCNLIKKSESTATLLQHNWLSQNKSSFVQDIKPVDLLLTSPPYPYSIDYSLALRLSNYLLGDEFQEMRKNEIGARYKRKRKNKSQDYLHELGTAFNNSSRYVKQGGLIVLVLPDPVDYKTTLKFDTESWLEFLRGNFSGSWELVDYSIRICQHRRVINKSKHTKNEIVAVYRRN